METPPTKAGIADVGVWRIPLSKPERKPRFILSAALVLFGGGLSSPQSWPLQQPSPLVDAAESNRNILVTAWSKTGAQLELSAADLQVKEDGQQAVVRDFRRPDSAPLHYCLLFDTSGSARMQFELQLAAATELLTKVIHAGRDRGWLVLFDSQAHFWEESDDPQEMARVLAQAHPLGKTALYDAMLGCADRMSKSARASGVRAMFVFSDGNDNESRFTQAEALEGLLKAEIRVYAVGVEGNYRDRDDLSGVQILGQFAKSTGGKIYSSFGKKGIDQAVAGISHELANSFVVTYTLPNQKPDGRLHKLEVKCSKKGILITAPTATIHISNDRQSLP